MTDRLPELTEFLGRHRISGQTWTAANIEWSRLSDISEDYRSRMEDLAEVASMHARTLQRCGGVHSVRWRVKDPEHLIEKIIRKRASQAEKYANIDVGNYGSIISDLIGLRALHLFKSDWQQVHVFISGHWQQREVPVAYVRDGDPIDIRDSYLSAGCRVDLHSAGYRSIHYIITTRPLRSEVLAEIQVRTLFEEGWSEIDHKVRYPNFSNNPLLDYFLRVFNRLAGSADEMGGFVQSMIEELARYEASAEHARAQMQDQVNRIEILAKQLAHHKERAGREESLHHLETVVYALRKASAEPPRSPLQGHADSADAWPSPASWSTSQFVPVATPSPLGLSTPLVTATSLFAPKDAPPVLRALLRGYDKLSWITVRPSLVVEPGSPAGPSLPTHQPDAPPPPSNAKLGGKPHQPKGHRAPPLPKTRKRRGT